MRVPLLLAALLLLALPACERPQRGGARAIYAPWEEGLTLAFENPTVPFPARRDQRLQVRVSRDVRTDGGHRVTYTRTSLQGQMELHVQIRKGGVSLVEEDRVIGRMLPEGFPDKVRSWEDWGFRFRVEGRAIVKLPVTLPSTTDPVGIWVQAEPIGGQGIRRRAFYIDGFGEVLTQVWQEGRWVDVNQLVSWGFTDAPAPKTR